MVSAQSPLDGPLVPVEQGEDDAGLILSSARLATGQAATRTGLDLPPDLVARAEPLAGLRSAHLGLVALPDGAVQLPLALPPLLRLEQRAEVGEASDGQGSGGHV